MVKSQEILNKNALEQFNQNANNKSDCKQRQSGLELLRIISMILIVFSHSAIFGNFDSNYPNFDRIIAIFKLGGKLGVNIFVLISAYFMVTKSFRWSRVFRLWSTAIFYSLLFFIIKLISGQEVVYKDILMSLFPLSYSHWWFVTTFVWLLLLSPALNILIKNIEKKSYAIGLIIFAFLFVIFPYINMVGFAFDWRLDGYSNIIWFVYLYMLAGYIRLYGIKIDKFVICVLLLFFVFIKLMSVQFLQVELFREEALGNFFMAIGLFLIFKDFKFKSKIVNFVASTMFGVYLVHENIFVRGWAWNNFASWLQTIVLNSYVCVVLSSFIVLLVCMLIEILRKQTVGRVVDKLILKFEKKNNKNKKMSQMWHLFCFKRNHNNRHLGHIEFGV